MYLLFYETWISKILKFDFHKNEKSLWNEKKHFPQFHECSLLDLKNKLAKMQWTQPLSSLLVKLLCNRMIYNAAMPS